MGTKIIDTKTNAAGHKVRLQQRRGAWDVIINSTGYAWRYLEKSVSEDRARNTFFLRSL